MKLGSWIDFPTIMVLLVALSGLIWAFDAAVLARKRKLALDHLGDDVDGDLAAKVMQPPTVVEYARSFFPVFLIVLVLRSFIAEPFRIPSNSMMPTLLTGDFILVNKYTYGIRIPVLGTKVITIGQPERGDVIVFKYPKEPSTPYIKRVVGVPGDEIAYYNKSLYINGEEMEQDLADTYVGYGSGVEMTGASLRVEHLPERDHEILIMGTGPGRKHNAVTIADGEYFVLGDNRDNSRDSRFWGTVPDELLIGRAFTIWMNWDWGHGIDWGRIGSSID